MFALMSFLPRSVRMQAAKVGTPANLGLLSAAVLLAFAFYGGELSTESGMCLLEDDARSSLMRGETSSQHVESSNRKIESLDGAQDFLDSFESRCTAMIRELEALQKQVTAVQVGQDALPKAASLFWDLRDLDMQYVDAMLVVERTQAANASELNQTSNKRLSTLKRSSMKVSFLHLITVARRVASFLPQESANANGAFGCKIGVLGSLEARAVREAEAEQDSAGALLRLGSFWSELATKGRTAAPLFGSGPVPEGGTSSDFVRDSWGTLAPADIVHAEDLLAKGAATSGSRRPHLISAHALRLQDHAKALQAVGQYDAANMRYLAMAKISQEAGHAALQALALSELSLSLKIRGSHEEAVAHAKDAVELTMSPLAQFVLASASLSGGLLTTEASMVAATNQLRAAENHLPTEGLELQRKRLHAEMTLWSWISKGDMSRCAMLHDSARFVICSIAKLLW
jgi:tetratricopeptide (TPR) repeat protein